jgi:hypothetical protein
MIVEKGNVMKSKTIPQEIYDQVEAELLEGEELLWVGLPDPRAMINRRQVKIVLAVILGLGFSVFMGAAMYQVRGAVMMTPFPYLTMILVMLGVMGIMAARSIFEFWANSRTIYAVTNRRALILNRRNVQSYGENDIEFIERQMRSANKGDIIFKRESRHRAAYYGEGVYGTEHYNEPIGFFGIDNPREVEALMLHTFRVRDDMRRFEKPKNEALEDSETPQYADDERDTQRLMR